MIDWAALLVQAVLTAVGAVAAERARIFKSRPLAVGLLFGALSAVAQYLPIAEIGYYDISVAVSVAPPMVAGFFYGPVAGLVSGGITCLVGALAVFDGYSMLLIVCGAFGTVAATLYAIVIGKWVFVGKRPPVSTAVIAAAYGVLVYLSVGALFGLDDLPTTLEVVLESIIPMAIGTCLSVGLAAVVCGSWRGLWRGFFSSLNLAFLFVGLAVSVTSTIIVLNARDEGDAIVRHALHDLTAEEENQARYMLHESAVNIVDSLGGLGREPTHADLAHYADVLGVDCISIADTNGLVVATTEKDLVPGQPIERDLATLRPYLELCGGSRPFVSKPFLPCGADADEYVKHFGFPLPHRGFLRLGYLWSRFQITFPQYIKPSLDGRHIGETGFYLIFNEQGRLELPVPDRPETKGLTYSEVGLDSLSQPYEKVFHARVLGTLCRCVTFEPFGGYQLYAVLPLAETQGPAFVISAIVALVLMIMCIVFRIVLVRFQQAQAKIDALRAEEERRRAADLALARAIQRAELRTDGTQGAGYRLSTLMNAAREVGGDFYDYYEMPAGRLVVTIADVSGKGIPAAFFMMKARMTLKSCIYSCATLVEAVAKANVRLAANNPAEMFVTAWVGIYDRNSGVLDFVSAGHNPPLVRRRDGSVEWLQAPRAAALGVFERACYRGAQVTLGQGDRLYLYTDGVTEAMNVRGELFGNERLEAVLVKAAGPLVGAVKGAVDEFAAGAEQADDITMLELAIGC